MRVCTLAELVVVKFVSSTSISLDLVKLRAVLSQRVLEVQSAREGTPESVSREERKSYRGVVSVHFTTEDPCRAVAGNPVWNQRP